MEALSRQYKYRPVIDPNTEISINFDTCVWFSVLGGVWIFFMSNLGQYVNVPKSELSKWLTRGVYDTIDNSDASLISLQRNRISADGNESQGCRKPGVEGAIAPPDFARSVYPILVRGAHYAHQITTCPPPHFSDPPTAMNPSFWAFLTDKEKDFCSRSIPKSLHT